MPESRRLAPILAGLAIVLTGVAAMGGLLAWIAGALAQPAWALAVRGVVWRDLAWRRDLPALAAWWGAATAIGLLLAWWPLSAMRAAPPGLGVAVAGSLALGVALVLAWRNWRGWVTLEREGGDARSAWALRHAPDRGAWRGLAAAASVVLVVAGTLWAGGSPMAPVPRWGVAACLLLAWPLLHGVLQRIPLSPPLRNAEWVALDDVADAFDATPAAMPAPEAAAIAPAELYAAARSGRVERALELLDAGADAWALPPPGDRDQRSLATLAAVLPDLRLLRALIARGLDVNASHRGMTPLLAATRDSWHGRPEAVMTLLANGADPRVADAEGNTPLHHAARSSDPGVAALLRDAAAELDVPNHDGLTPLGVACAAGNWRMAKFLLERGARPQVEGSVPALLAAAGTEEDDAAGVQLLLRHKAAIDARDAEGRSALHHAAHAGHAGILQALMAAGADLEARDARQATPLLEAAGAGRLAAIDALAAADIAAVDGEGRGALARASLGAQPGVALLQRLLQRGADASLRDHAGLTAADHARSAGRWPLVAALEPDYVLPASVRERGEDAGEGDAEAPTRTPVSLLRDALAARDSAEAARLLPLVPVPERGGLLHAADLRHDADAIDWLLRHGADPATPDARGDGLGLALPGGGPQVLPALRSALAHGLLPAGRGGLARYLAAWPAQDPRQHEGETVALQLLERGADPFGASTAGDPPLALALRLGWSRLASRLIEDGAALDARDSHGMTPLHIAAALGQVPLLRQLVARGASPDLRAADGQTALGVALASGRREIAEWLDWQGWPLPRRALQPRDLPAAAIVGDAAAVRRLLDLGFAVDTVDAQGCTALLRAAGGGHLATVEDLLARGADPARAAHSGATPLSAAVSMRQGAIVDRLLAAGATLEQRLPGDVTVLMLAAALGLPDVCARLLNAGANIQATDAQGLTPMHCATLFGFTARERPRLLALFDTLLLAGADAGSDASAGATPLLLLLGARAEPGTACDEDVLLAGLERLLDEEVDLAARDPRGFGPLHLAALHGLSRMVQCLLRAGADPNLRDGLNRTPRDIAVMRGFVDVAAEFDAAPAGVSMARFLREPR